MGTQLDAITFDAPIVRRVFWSNAPTLGLAEPITLVGENFGRVRPDSAKVTIGLTVRSPRPFLLPNARARARSSSRLEPSVDRRTVRRCLASVEMHRSGAALQASVSTAWLSDSLVSCMLPKGAGSALDVTVSLGSRALGPDSETRAPLRGACT